MASVLFDAKIQPPPRPEGSDIAVRDAGTPAEQILRHTVRSQSRIIPATDTYANHRGTPFPTTLSAIGALDVSYLTQASREKTVVICGASKDLPIIEKISANVRKLAHDVVAAGGNVVSGCGTKGVLGAAFYGAAQAADLPGAGENLTITKNKAWGDEDFVHGRAISKEETEELRFDQYQRIAGTIIIMPGSLGTFLETAKMLEGVYAPRAGLPQFDTIILCDVDGFWGGLRTQLDTMVKSGLLKPEVLARIQFVDASADLSALAMPASLRKS
jgi:predicted Rossmann-fold nucleotide-binding protein